MKSSVVSGPAASGALLRYLFFGVVWGLLLAWGAREALGDVAPLYLTNSPATSQVLVLDWNPSQDPALLGYFLCWGSASGQCTNQWDVGNVTHAAVAGFTNGTAYFFTVIAYNDLGLKSDPSNELQYAMTNSGSATPLMLGIQLLAPGGSPNGVHLTFQGRGGGTYSLLASQDFVSWATIGTTNCASDVTVAFDEMDVSQYSSRFYKVVQQ